MSILSDLAFYLLFICNGRRVLLLFILLSPWITDLSYSEHFYVHFTQNHTNVTVLITLKGLMTVCFFGIMVACISGPMVICERR